MSDDRRGPARLGQTADRRRNARCPRRSRRCRRRLDDQLAFFLWLRDYRKEIAAPDASMTGSVEKSYVKALYPRYQPP